MQLKHYVIECRNECEQTYLPFFIIVIFISFLGGKHIKNACGKSVYGSSHWPKHTVTRSEKILLEITDIHIQTLLVSQSITEFAEKQGNLLWSYYRSCVRKTQTWQIRTCL